MQAPAISLHQCLKSCHIGSFPVWAVFLQGCFVLTSRNFYYMMIINNAIGGMFIMMALNFQAAKHKKMLMERTKNCTVRLGDVSAEFPENSIVWITTGKKGEPKSILSMSSWRISRRFTSAVYSRKIRSRSSISPRYTRICDALAPMEGLRPRFSLNRTACVRF